MRDWPAPATPANDFVKAMRAGCAVGCPVPSLACAIAGLSIDVGDAAAGAWRCVRDGEPVMAASGFNVGTLAVGERREVLRASCVDGLDEGAFSDG